MNCRSTKQKRIPHKAKTKPKHIVTDKSKAEVAALISFGNTQEDIAKYLGIGVSTLSRHYADVMATALLKANAQVANRLYKKATEENDLAAQIFWLKTRARWRTADSENLIEEQSKIKDELNRIKQELDEKNKKDY